MPWHHTKIGSVSSGTLRPEDLIPEFLRTLESLNDRWERQLAPDDVESRKVAEGHRELVEDIREDSGEDGYYDSEDAAEDVDELIEALDFFAPPFASFGGSEGDGADFGFWPSVESLEEAVQDDEVLKIDAGDEWPPEADDYDYVMEVNDHGNVTLFESESGEEIWSTV